jgi:hypothetical protein
MNQLSAPERETIQGLLRLAWSIRRICRETGHRHETVRRIGQEAGLLPPDRRMQSRTPRAKCPPTSKPCAMSPVRSRGRAVAASPVTLGSSRLRSSRVATRSRSYQDLVEHHGYEGSYDAVKRIDPKVSCRFETAPGQVITAKERRRAMRAAASTQAAALRDDARYEAPRVLESRLALAAKVVSTAREGICLFRRCSSNDSSRTSKRVFSSPTSYESELNALNPATPAHHGVIALLCRPYAPDSKGKVESAVGHTQSTALQGR